ncbi:hypothetical protein KFK09_000934 [Dendrobium nobile]|uniref:Uncharacterized protein n=1 Tax=Dendrobium nobile TaxID=94219 RepID=A0A8T3CGC4_DENNO|nr:hypothetical protein KFK09_000934 [Dendrobium nobile]
MTITMTTTTTTMMTTTATILTSTSNTGTSLLRRSCTTALTSSPHWYKDFRWGNEVKDEEELPAFALINKATGLAIKHSLGPKHPVRLIPFNPEYIDESILWTESHDTGEGYCCIRMVNNIRLGFDAFHGDKDHGGVHDGTTVVLWEWLKGKNQRWKIVPFYCEYSYLLIALKIKCLFYRFLISFDAFLLLLLLHRGKV